MHTMFTPEGGPLEAQAPLVFAPSDVAARLGVSSAMVRLYALAWERVTGAPLARAARGRLFTLEQVQALEQARRHAASVHGSIDGGLRRVLGLEEAPRASVQALPPEDPAVLDALRELRALLQAQAQAQAAYAVELTARLDAQARELAALREQLARVQALPAPQDPEDPIAPDSSGGHADPPRPRPSVLARLFGRR